MVPVLSGWPSPIRPNWFVNFVCSAASVHVAYHRGRSMDRSCSCSTLPTCYCLLRAMVSALICMQMTPKSMGSVVRLQRLSFRTSSLPASMMLPGGCAPIGSRWILQRPRLCGLHPVDASIWYQCHPSEWVPTKSCQFPLSAISASTWTLMCQRSHVSNTVAACFAIMRQLWRIRRSVPRCVLQSQVSSLVLQRLDYGNATVAGIPSYRSKRMQ